MSNEPKAIFTSSKEVWLFGKYVSICWDLIKGQRYGKPYIAFPDIRYNNDNHYYYEADNDYDVCPSVTDGLDLEEANQLLTELQVAIEYLRKCKQ
jgi:hypothetical protein